MFLPAKTIDTAIKTVDSYRWFLEKKVYPLPLADMKMKDITTAQLRALVLSFQKAGLAHSTCVRWYTILSGLFKMAYMDETIRENPMDRVQRPKEQKDSKKTSNEPETFTAKELAFILECLEQEPLYWQCYMLLLAYTGVRRGEGCALRWENIDFKKGTAEINASVGYIGHQDVYITTPKSGKARTVTLPTDLLAKLRALRAEQAETGISQWCFPQSTDKTKPMHPDSGSQFCKRFSRRWKIQGWHFHLHKLRHTFASLALENGADVVSVSQVLGHADTAITLRVYAHASEEGQKRASKIFEDTIKAASTAAG